MYVYICICIYWYVYLSIYIFICWRMWTCWNVSSVKLTVTIDTFLHGNYCNACVCMKMYVYLYKYMYVYVGISICVGISDHERGALRYRKTLKSLHFDIVNLIERVVPIYMKRLYPLQNNLYPLQENVVPPTSKWCLPYENSCTPPTIKSNTAYKNNLYPVIE